MANAVRIENLSKADQELAPGSGFIPPGGHADYPPEVYREKHERYVKPRLEADPPLLKVTEFDSPEIGRRDADLQKVAEDDKKAAEERAAAELLAEAEKKAAEQKQGDNARLTAEKQAEEQRQQNEGGHKRGR